jgi:hypothetical protein
MVARKSPCLRFVRGAGWKCRKFGAMVIFGRSTKKSFSADDGPDKNRRTRGATGRGVTQVLARNMARFLIYNAKSGHR